MYKYFPLIILLTLSCGVAQEKSNESDARLEDLKLEYFGQSSAEIPNEDSSYVIVFSKYKKPSELMSSIKFFVFDNSQQTIIYEDTLENGVIKWLNKIEFEATARHQRKDAEDTTPARVIYVYNIANGEKVVQ